MRPSKRQKVKTSKRQNARPTEKDEDLILGMTVSAIVHDFLSHLPRQRHFNTVATVEASLQVLRDQLPKLRLQPPAKPGAAKRRPRMCHYRFGMVLSRLAISYAHLFPRDDGRKAIDAMCAYFYELWEIHRKMKFPRRRR